MSPISHFLILFFFSFFLLSVHIAFGGDEQEQQETVHFDLMHRHHPKVAEKIPELKFQGINDRLKDIHDHDNNRYRMISSSLHQEKLELKMRLETKKTAHPEIPSISPTPIGLKMMAGADWGAAEYFVHIKAGTPPQTFILIADTGSDLTWVKCRYRRCLGNCSTNASHRSRNAHRFKFSKPFLANRSSSFKTVNCSSTMCSEGLAKLFSIEECPTPTSPCRYDYSYIGGGIAKGIFAWETLTVGLTNGKEKPLYNSLIGCTESVDRKFYEGADGIIGLGTSFYSFTYKATENHNGGGFSYCLVDHFSDQTATSYFVLGFPNASAYTAASSVAPSGNMTFTKLFLGEPYKSFYGVDLTGISADGVMLNIPPAVWDIDSGGGTILDSGTSLTMLAAPAFDAIMKILIEKFKKLQKLEIDTFKLCFNSSGYHDGMAPHVRFHFRDGAVLAPPVKSYVLSFGEHVKCIGFVSMPFPATNIIGNVMQQNHLWRFDFFKGTVGFAPSDCAKPSS